MPCDIFLPRKKYELEFVQLRVTVSLKERRQKKKKTALDCIQQNPEYVQLFQQINCKRSNVKKE